MMSHDMFAGLIAIGIAFLCTCFAVIASLWQILMHLRNYTEPTFQRYIVRIIFMVPVYATMSFLALVFSGSAIWFNTIRDVYEAWVIYNFLSLCLAWVGGPGAVVTSLNGRILKPSYFLMTCCFPPIPLDGRFIRRCKQGGLQFVFLKPILAATCLILYSYGKYAEGNFSPREGYLYITLIYMVSYSLAIYSLILFYIACKDLLKPYKPVPKFLMIKSVVFLTYWQGVLVFLISLFGVVHDERDAADLQNLLICVEMALAAIGFMYAFPHKPYMEANVGETAGLTTSISHAMNVKDVINDTVHQFAPTYHDYVLYSDGSQEAPRRYRTRTFVPTGQEMDALRKQKGANGRGLDDSSSYYGSNPVSRNVSSNIGPDEVGPSLGVASSTLGSEDMKGSLLYDPQLSSGLAYDLRPLQHHAEGSQVDEIGKGDGGGDHVDVETGGGRAAVGAWAEGVEDGLLSDKSRPGGGGELGTGNRRADRTVADEGTHLTGGC